MVGSRIRSGVQQKGCRSYKHPDALFDSSSMQEDLKARVGTFCGGVRAICTSESAKLKLGRVLGACWEARAPARLVSTRASRARRVQPSLPPSSTRQSLLRPNTVREGRNECIWQHSQPERLKHNGGARQWRWSVRRLSFRRYLCLYSVSHESL